VTATGCPVLIAIAGCSGSGKTTLAEELARELEGTHFHLDHYYRDLGHMPLAEREQENFDHPDSLEHELLVTQLSALKQGQPIARPVYDFSTYTRIPGVEERVVEPHVLLIDGIFALYYPELRALADLRIYVDATDEICFERRLARDTRERGRSPQSVAAHYAATVRPMAERYIRPSSQHADLIVEGGTSLDWSVEQVLGILHRRHLLQAEEELPLGLS
jgi:uridine kinase